MLAEAAAAAVAAAAAAAGVGCFSPGFGDLFSVLQLLLGASRCAKVRCGLDLGGGWWLNAFLKKAGRGAQERGRELERRECVTALGKFKVTAPSTAAGSWSGDRRRNFAASRPCVCARGSVSECARVAGRARERAWVGAGWVGKKGEAGVREGTRAQVSRVEKAPGARSLAAAAAARAGSSTPGRPPRPASDPAERGGCCCRRCPEPRGIGTSS